MVHLPRQGGHFGKSRLTQALLENIAKVVDIAFERGNGYFAGKGVAVFCVSFFAGQMAEGFRAAFAHFFCTFRVFNGRVFVARAFINFAKVRHIGIDITPRIAVPQGIADVLRQAEIPKAQQAARSSLVAELAADVLLFGKGHGKAEYRQLELAGMNTV